MCQLKYDYDFNNIIKDILYWKTKEDIPNHIIEYMKSLSKKMLFNLKSEKFYCFECLNELDSNYYCKHCNISYKEQKENEDWISFSSMGKYQSHDSLTMYVFDIYLDKPILYLLRMNILYSYYSHMAKTLKNYEIEIHSAFLIEKCGFTDLNLCQFYDFDEYYKFIYNDKEEYGNTNIEEKYKDLIDLSYNHGLIYTDNLEQLKNTVLSMECQKVFRIKETNNYKPINILTNIFSSI